MAANGFADQSNSFLTSFYFTALWLLYCSATAVALGDRKSCAPSFPENHQKTPEQSIRKSLFPQSHWTCITQSAVCCCLQWELGWHWGFFFCNDQLRGLIIIWHLCGPLVMGAQSECVCLLVGVCACDRAPHCCSDVSSLCSRPMTVTPSLLVLSWGTEVSGLPLLSAPPSPNPLPFWLQSPHPPTAESYCWALTAADQWLWFSDVNWT